VTPRESAVLPDQPARRDSIFRQAIEHGSKGMQLDELGNMQRGI